MSERTPPRDAFTQAALREYFKPAPGELALNPLRLGVTLRLRNLDGARVGRSLYNNILTKDGSEIKIKTKVAFLYGMQGTGKSVAAEEMVEEVLEQTKRTKKADLVEIDGAVAAVEEEFGPRAYWGEEQWRMVNERFVRDVERSVAENDFTAATLTGIGKKIDRNRGNSALEYFARTYRNNGIFVGFIPDPRVQAFATQVREEVSAYQGSPEDFFKFLEEQRGIVITAPNTNSLFSRIDPWVQAAVTKDIFSRAAVAHHVETLYREIEDVVSGKIAENTSLRHQLQGGVPPFLTGMDEVTRAKFKVASTYLDHYATHTLGLSQELRGRNFLIVNPMRRESIDETGKRQFEMKLYHFLHDGIVRQALVRAKIIP